MYRSAHDIELRLRALISHTNAGVVQADALGRMTLVNERWCEMLGYTEAELLGMSLADVTAPDSLAETSRTLQQLAAGGPPFVIQKNYRRKNGSVLAASSSVSALRTDAGEYAGLVAIVFDLGESRHAEEALRLSQQQLLARESDLRVLERALHKADELLLVVTDTIPNLISYVDRDFRYLLCNRAYSQWFGLPRERIVGQTIRALVGEGAWPAIAPHLQAALAGETADFETEAQYAHGGSRWIHAIYTPHVDRSGEVVGIVVLVSDITARRHAEDALREADQRKDEFLAILAHELRNPLAPIRTSLELLRGASDPPGMLPRVLPVLERQVAHVVRLVDDLLDVSRITSGHIALRRRAEVLSDLVRDAVEGHQAAFARAGVSLGIALPEEVCVLEVDHARIVQVLSNLLANAIRFTEEGGRIEIRARVVGGADSGPGELELAVHDTGIGIPPETLPHIFDLFVQGHHPERPRSGLGIGLALARQLVELHGGALEATSGGVGRGSVFTLRLPLSATSPQPVAEAEPPEDAGPLSMRVLVVDDNVDAADTLAILVQAAGAEVRTAYGGEDALKVGRTFQPDAVLLDVGMPGLDGYATCRQLRTEPWGRTAYVVAITGWGQPRDRQRAMDAGFDAHLTKPADPGAIQRLLADLPLRQPGS